MRKLNLALLSAVCLAAPLMLPATPALAAKAGVTAAVNPQAVGTPPGGGVKTIVLGEDVLTNEKIDTTGGGLVQILLADGTTFTVGPNSSLTIDKFVYDPEANTAQVTASLAKGVFRFIGGRTSKTEGGVTINTPVGTVGIRGAVADINLTPDGQTLKAQIDLLFGKEVTLSGPGGLIDRIFKAGYSIVIGNDGHAQLVKTPPGSANTIQQALAGKPGTNGGAGSGPSDGQVANSDVPKTNSDSPPPPPSYTPPDLKAIELATIDFFDTHDNAQQILDGQEKAGPIGFSAAAVLDDDYEVVDFLLSGENGTAVAVDGDHHHKHITASDLTLSSVVGSGATLHVTTGQGPDTATVSDGTATYLVDEPDNRIWVAHQQLCHHCYFMQWGGWKSSLDAPEGLEGGPVEVKGLWVTGDFPGATEFDSYASGLPVGTEAYYHGSARGYETDEDGGVRSASGDLDMSWAFGTRQGDLAISEYGFDSRNMSAHVDGSGGRFSGSGHLIVDGDPSGSFGVNGAFVKNGSDVAGGVIGNFSASDEDWSTTGIFGGKYTGSEPSPQ